MRPFKDLADAIKDVHETKLRNAVKEIVVSGEYLISSHLKMDMNSLVSVLQHKSIRLKFKLLYTNLKSNYALTRFRKKLPKLFHQLGPYHRDCIGDVSPDVFVSTSERKVFVGFKSNFYVAYAEIIPGIHYSEFEGLVLDMMKGYNLSRKLFDLNHIED
ncbi:hypothetical protein ABG067_003887 [Albugo candida]